MKTRLSNLLKYENLELIAYIYLLLWAISPIIEYILKNYIQSIYVSYYVFIIYAIGIAGIIEYFIYLYKKRKDKSLKIKKCIPQIILLLLFIISIISTICSDNPHLSLFGESYRREGLIVYTMYIGFILSSSIIKNKDYIRIIIKTIVFSALFITIMPFFTNVFTYDNFTNIYHNTNHYGYFLMISTMLAGFLFFSEKSKIKKILYLIIYTFLFHIVIINDTFGCYLAIFTTLIFVLVYSLITKHKRVECMILILLFILSSILIPHYNIKLGEKFQSSSINRIVINNLLIFSNDIKLIINNDPNIGTIGTGRGLLWEETWKYTLNHPLVGGGMECLKAYLKTTPAGYNDRPHNSVLQVAAFIGIPGAILYIILIFYLALSNLKNLKKNGFNMMIYATAMCYFISSLAGNSMYYTSPYFMILLGLLMGMNKNIL